jgi:hypothetical protein
LAKVSRLNGGLAGTDIALKVTHEGAFYFRGFFKGRKYHSYHLYIVSKKMFSV